MKIDLPQASRADLLAGLKQGVVVGLATLMLVLPPLAVPKYPVQARVAATPPSQASRIPLPPRVADFGQYATSHAASFSARYVADWVADSRDNAKAPFVILDKRDARVFVFDADARLVDTSPVLLGLARGDDSVADIGSRPIALVRPEERTTPAGRFVSSPGRNDKGEDVVWVDYDAAVSMHRVRAIDPTERRLERLASPDASQRRISYGCINVPVAFYNDVIHRVVGSRKAVVYVLPETKDVRDVFTSAYAVPRAALNVAGGATP